jgi:hypothetical protein
LDWISLSAGFPPPDIDLDKFGQVIVFGLTSAYLLGLQIKNDDGRVSPAISGWVLLSRILSAERLWPLLDFK